MAEAKVKVGLIKLADMREDPRNARTHDDAQVNHLADLMEQFGFTQPPLIDRSAEDLIVAGHGRKRAALLVLERGNTLRLPDGTALPPGKVPFIDVSGWDEDKRRAYAIADNQSALMADWDAEILLSELDALSDAGLAAASLGFDDETMARLMAEADPDPGQGRQQGELRDSEFEYADQYGIVVQCKDAAEQEARFNELRDKFGADQVKVVVV
jgi:ParB-like chromosome segregation protein Spo0J